MADRESFLLWEKLRLAYTESPGHPLLREEISALYTTINTDDVLVMVPEEAIFLTMHALLEPGDHVICTTPAYQSLHQVARSIGCRVTEWLPNEQQGWRFEVGDLESMLGQDTQLVVVNFPHNPTGYLPPEEDFRALVDLVQQRGIKLLSDEMYRYLEVGPETTLPAACDLYSGAISLSGLSKSYGLPGLRIGWLATRYLGLLERVSVLKDYTTICNSAPSEILGIIALRNRLKIVADQLVRVRRNLALLDDFFDHYAAIFEWKRPGGGSICFPRMLSVEDTEQFCERLVQDTGIMLLPSSMFQFGNHHVRVGFGREDLPEVIDLFAVYIDTILA